MTSKKFKKEDWEPPVLMAEAVNSKGIVELQDEIEKHKKSRKALSRESIIRRKKAMARFELIDMMKSRLVEEALNHITSSLEFKKCLDCIIDGTKDPYSACDELLSRKLSFLEDENTE
jgi:LAO/AO transport system kinase